MIALEKLNPHDFLFAAAIDPFREADFDFFLSHPLCSVEALNERAQTLEQWIQVQADSVLSPEIKAARIAKIKAHSKHLRTQRAV